MKFQREFFLLTSCLTMATLLFCVACSNSKSGGAASTHVKAAAGGLPEPCSLITPAEAETAMGKGATVASEFNTRIGMAECRVKGTTPGLEQIIMVVHPAEQWDTLKKGVTAPGMGITSVSGLGDDAFVGRAIGYNVRKGTKYVQVFGVLTNKDAPNDKAARYLAERAASRL
jgi:hypothetical protein